MAIHEVTKWEQGRKNALVSNKMSLLAVPGHYTFMICTENKAVTDVFLKQVLQLR